jgi:hypothetical protein
MHVISLVKTANTGNKPVAAKVQLTIDMIEMEKVGEMVLDH